MKIRLQQINDSIVDFVEPYVVSVSNLAKNVTVEDIYYFFGGNEKVVEVIFIENRTGEALVEVKDLEALASALLLKDAEFFKKKLNVEYVDCKNGNRYMPNPKMRPPPKQQSSSSSIFGGAKPIDTNAKLLEMAAKIEEEKKVQVIMGVSKRISKL
jgi:RNA recognition motif-containing protein